jgi:hypothetical protein
MATGDVKPVEATEEEDPPLHASTALQGPIAIPGPVNMQDMETPCLKVESPGPGGSVLGHGGSKVWDNNQQEDEHIQDNEPQADVDDDNQPLHQPSGRPPHLRVHQSVQWDHPVDNILGSIRNGVTTRSRLANFCQFYSFVSSLEPLKVDEALKDLDWVMAMQEELNNFDRNQVWELVERSKTNVIGTKWVF